MPWSGTCSVAVWHGAALPWLHTTKQCALPRTPCSCHCITSCSSLGIHHPFLLTALLVYLLLFLSIIHTTQDHTQPGLLASTAAEGTKQAMPCWMSRTVTTKSLPCLLTALPGTTRANRKVHLRLCSNPMAMCAFAYTQAHRHLAVPGTRLQYVDPYLTQQA
jgi:hypothetical protein